MVRRGAVPTKLDPRTEQVAGEIGRRLRRAREAGGLSQATLAEKIGMTRGNLARIEAGRTNVTVESLVRIAGGVGLRVRVVLGRREDR